MSRKVSPTKLRKKAIAALEEAVALALKNNDWKSAIVGAQELSRIAFSLSAIPRSRARQEKPEQTRSMEPETPDTEVVIE